jgi:alkane 1-monooxygenase
MDRAGWRPDPRREALTMPMRAPEQDPNPVSALQAVRSFTPHLLALLFPLNALAFVLTGPHRAWVAALFMVPVFGSVVLDARSGATTRQPAAKVPAWPFDGLLVVLSVVQIANVLLLARMAAHMRLVSLDTLVAMVVVGSSSGYSGIVVAHELIHRHGRGWQLLGRVILATVVYEHFYTEHLRGHHLRVGTDDDPATARFGESFNRFYLRTVPAQFRSAWRIEATRLGDADMKAYDPRLLRSRVLHGVVVEGAMAAALAVLFGPVALVAHAMQAWWATRALEVVNYFEHWGLRRDGRRVTPTDSWDTSSRFTYYALTGLSRHADHHAFASRPYQQLRAWDESPKLPGGYLAMFPLVLGRNRRFQRLMTEELRRRKLGPFAPGGSSEAA